MKVFQSARYAHVARWIRSLGFADFDQRASERTTRQHRIEDPRQSVQADFMRADGVEVRRFPVGCKVPPDLIADVAGGPGGSNTEQADAADDERHHRGFEF